MNQLIEPYNPQWKTGFENLRLVLSEHLQAFTTDIQHVGSTAVPGMPAKPILDIDIIIPDTGELNGISAVLNQLGYQARGDQGIPGRYAFRQSAALTPVTPGAQSWPQHHLYVCLAGSLAVKNHLLFRDALLQDTALASAYAAMKIRLANEKGMTREQYTRKKTEFILQALAALGLDQQELEAVRNANA